eukprot:PITA_09152
MASESKVTLKSSDDELFDVTEAVAFESQTIKYIIEDTGTANAILLPNVSSKILSKVIEYCKYHVEAHKAEHEKSRLGIKNSLKSIMPLCSTLSCFVALFSNVVQMHAANYLNIKNLLDLTFQTVADMIKGKTPEEIRKTFNIKDDFTPQEEEEVRLENEWVFE